MSTRQLAIINAMKYLAKHNDNLDFKVNRPNKYNDFYWTYYLIDNTKMFFATIQKIRVRGV